MVIQNAYTTTVDLGVRVFLIINHSSFPTLSKRRSVSTNFQNWIILNVVRSGVCTKLELKEIELILLDDPCRVDDRSIENVQYHHSDLASSSSLSYPVFTTCLRLSKTVTRND